jgi:hypothetical protein
VKYTLLRRDVTRRNPLHCQIINISSILNSTIHVVLFSAAAEKELSVSHVILMAAYRKPDKKAPHILTWTNEHER